MIRGVFETHLEVADLDRAVAFYTGPLGLPLAMRDDARRIAFLWAGGTMRTMLGLWECRERPIATRHTAFEVELADLRPEIVRLNQAGIATYDFWKASTTEPFVFGWMPAAAIYFDDPDGNWMELIAALPGDAYPEKPVISLADWIGLQSWHALVPGVQR